MLKILKNNLFLYKKQLFNIAVFCILIFIPNILFAQIEITEIMYSLEGVDGGREWIEVFNTGNKDIDLSKWKLYETETNHRIKAVVEDGNAILEPDNYAILVDNYEKFKEDQPNFSGLVLDTSFSLKNTGELLIIRNSDLMDIDSVDYLSNWGASGDGKSLQKINGEWVSAIPTPGEANSQDFQSLEESSSQNETSSPSISITTYKTEPQIFAQILPLIDIPIAGADFLFEVKAYGLQNEPLLNAEYQWTFGDGSKAKGQKVLHNYQYPSDYLVVLEVISGKYSASNRLKVKVIPTEVFISSLKISSNDNFIEIHNPSNYETNLSWWRLRSDNFYFTLPKNTILLPKAYIKFPFSVTKLLPRENSIVQLLYPNGMLAFDYLRESVLEQKPIISVAENFKPSIGQDKEDFKTKSEPLLYTVEKPSSLRREEFSGTGGQSSRNNSNNQTATIKNSLLDKPTKSREVKSLEGEKGSEKRDKFKFPLNKWSFMLGGIILIAVVGVGYATKLDVDDEKTF